MTGAYRDPEPRQSRADVIEADPLLGKRRMVGRVSGRKVRIHRIDGKVRAGRNLGQRAIEVVVPEAESIHAGIDLQVAPQHRRLPRGGLLQRPRRRRRGDRRRQAMREDAFEIADAEGAEHQDGHADASLAQHHAFLDVRTRQHRRASLLERPGHLRRAVSVGIGLDDRNDPRGRCLAAAGEEFADGL